MALFTARSGSLAAFTTPARPYNCNRPIYYIRLTLALELPVSYSSLFKLHSTPPPTTTYCCTAVYQNVLCLAASAASKDG